MMQHRDNDLNVIAFLHEIWSARVFLLVALFLSLGCAFLSIKSQQQRYEARMMIAPAQSMDLPVQARYEDGNSAYLYGGQSSGVEGVSRLSRFEAVVQGVSTAKTLLRDPRIAAGVLQDKRFERSETVVEGDEGVSAAALAHYIRQNVAFDPFGETAMREMVFQHPDPVFAQYFLQQIHRVSDQNIRLKLRSRIDERIAYLQREIGKAGNPEQRRLMTNMLMEQERARMVASMDAPVSASVVEDVFVSTRSVWPDSYLFYGGFSILGLMLGYIVFGVATYQNRPAARYEPAFVGSGSGLFLARAEKMHASRDNSASSLQGDHHAGQERARHPLKYSSWFQSRADNTNRKNLMSQSLSERDTASQDVAAHDMKDVS